MSQAVARSSAAADAAALDRADDRERASSSALKQSISLRSDSWKASRSRAVVACRAPRRRRRRRRATCRRRSACRSTRSTSARVRPSSLQPRTASRKAGKNAGVIVFMRSGRFSCRWATPSSRCESAKNSFMRASMRSVAVARNGGRARRPRGRRSTPCYTAAHDCTARTATGWRCAPRLAVRRRRRAARLSSSTAWANTSAATRTWRRG